MRWTDIGLVPPDYLGDPDAYVDPVDDSPVDDDDGYIAGGDIPLPGVDLNDADLAWLRGAGYTDGPAVSHTDDADDQ